MTAKQKQTISPSSAENYTGLLGLQIQALAERLQQSAEKITQSPSDWIEQYFYVFDPRDPITGERFSPGPIRLASHQKRIIDEALSKKPNGDFKYSTIIYSATKKSGKSALTSAVIFYMGMNTPYANLFCLANDGEQSSDRLYNPIKICLSLHKQLQGPFKDIRYSLDEVVLPNAAKIEAVPCDAAGNAGSQPLLSAWSELWAFKTDKKKQLWTEMTVPPTLFGRALRWVESYAGHVGESELLEGLYDLGVKQGTPHPDFRDLTSSLSDNEDAVVFVNEGAGIFCYWDHEPRMTGWQTPEYYAMEAKIHDPSEFNRIHKNLWTSSVDIFVQQSWWDACIDPNLPMLRDGDKTPLVVGIDVAVTQDCAAMVAVSRHPYNPRALAIRLVRVFSPKQTSGNIPLEDTVGATIKDWNTRFNVLCWTYDPKEMKKLAQDYTNAGYGWFYEFNQQSARAVADKQLYDMIVNRDIAWNPNTTEGDVGNRESTQECLYNHITRAGVSKTNDSYRLEKLAKKVHIDAAVATSMAGSKALALQLDGGPSSAEDLLLSLQRGEITLEEFSQRMRELNAELAGLVK